MAVDIGVLCIYKKDKRNTSCMVKTRAHLSFSWSRIGFRSQTRSRKSHGSSPGLGPKLVPVLGPGPWSRSRYIYGPGLGLGPGQNFCYRHTMPTILIPIHGFKTLINLFQTSLFITTSTE